MRLVALLARLHGPSALVWAGVLSALAGLALPSYATTYADEEARRLAVEAAQSGSSSTVLYGHLPDPGTPAQMFVWETGTFLTLLASLAAVLITVRVTRGAEADGTLETLRGTGVGRVQQMAAGAAVVGAASLVTGAGVAGATGWQSVDGVTVEGALVLGGVVAATMVLVASLTAMVAQVVASPAATRGIALALVGAMVVLRAVGDTQDVTALATLNPLGLRRTAGPFTTDRWAPLAGALAGALVLTAVAASLALRREHGGALLAARDSRPARLHVRTLPGLAWRQHRLGSLLWACAVATFGGFLVGMGEGVVSAAERGDLSGGVLGNQVTGGSPVTAFVAYCAVLLGALTACQGVLHVLRAGGDERGGLTELVRGTGRHRWAPLASAAATAGLATLATLAVSALVAAVVADRTLDRPGVSADAAQLVLGQWPAVLALVGLTATAVGLRPRLGVLGWVLLGGSALLALLGQVLGAPDRLIDASAFGHASATRILPPAQVCLLLVGSAATGLGLVAVSRRDVPSS